MKRIVVAVISILIFTAFAIQAIGQTAFKGAGVIESTTGGFKFPDGSVQLSAVSTPCTAITYLPYVISNEGVYCFTGNLETSITSGNAITVEADNVVIDLNGWKLDGLGAGTATETNGIYAYQRNNITIRNGTIRGFIRAVYLNDIDPFTSSQGHLVEYIRAERNTRSGIWINGSNNIVRNNHILDMVCVTSLENIYGIRLEGPGGRSINNDITGMTSSIFCAPMGINFYGVDSGIIKGNRISDVTCGVAHCGGINIAGEFFLVEGNKITNADNGIEMYGTGKYRDNLTSGVTAPYTGGTDAGGND